MSPEAVDIADKDGSTALHMAAQEGHKEVCELLINKISPEAIDIVDKDGSTALHMATQEGHKEVCELLINKMSQEAINVADSNDRTVLYVAAFLGHKEVCKLLINKMSPEAVDIADKGGSTALHVAAQEGHKEVCEMLINKMSPEAVDIADKDGSTALHMAALLGHKDVCEVLVRNMCVKNSMQLLKQNSNDLPIQKIIGEIVVDFINNKFLGNESNLMNFTGYQIKLLKLYQVVEHDLVKSYFNEEKGNNLCIGKVNNYITKHYFTLIGVCKSVNEDSLISKLITSDCMPHMLSYLAPHNLCPELFLVEDSIKLSGES
jgi:ankyrin repeat protein